VQQLVLFSKRSPAALVVSQQAIQTRIHSATELQVSRVIDCSNKVATKRAEYASMLWSIVHCGKSGFCAVVFRAILTGGPRRRRKLVPITSFSAKQKASTPSRYFIGGWLLAGKMPIIAINRTLLLPG
jgi:hypothetical protein